MKEKNAPLFELAVATMVAVTSDKWLGMRAILALFVSTCLASAQEGPITSRHGVDHDTWHAQFYSKLVKDDGGSCCNFNDCRPTLSRSVGNHYEVLVDGEWTAVPPDTIRKVVAPDQGAHVCAPQRTALGMRASSIALCCRPRGEKWSMRLS